MPSHGTFSSRASDDHKGQTGTAVWIRSFNYAGVEEDIVLNVSAAILYVTRCLTGSQWSDLRSGLASVRPPRISQPSLTTQTTSEKDQVMILTDRVRKSFKKVHGEMEVSEAGEVPDLFRQILQLVLRDVQLTQLLQLTNLLQSKVSQCNMIMH